MKTKGLVYEGEVKKYIYEFTCPIVGSLWKEEPIICRDHMHNTDGVILDTSGKEHAIEDSSFHFTDEQVEEYTGIDRQLFDLCEQIEVTE